MKQSTSIEKVELNLKFLKKNLQLTGPQGQDYLRHLTLALFEALETKTKMLSNGQKLRYVVHAQYT